MRYQVLGPLEAYADGSPVTLGGPKQRLVLAILLIETDRVVSDDRLVDELWGDAPPDGARHAIQTYVSELRRVLDDEIAREGSGYRLRVERIAIDAYRFESLVAAGRQRMDDAPAAAAATFREALAFWHGDPYGGVAEAPMLDGEIHRLNEMRLAAVEDRIAADLDVGRHNQVVPELQALSLEQPFRERLHALNMLALYRADRQADALRAYHRARRWLVEEMGIDPSLELQSLERRILDQDPSLAQAAEAPVTLVAAAGELAGEGAIRGFEVRELVGERGIRRTYRAYQASVGREVAIAVIRSGLVQQASFMRDFDQRGRQIAQLDHPNLVPLLDWWRDPAGAYVVTPWIRGGNLRKARTDGAPWGVARTLRMLEQVGGGLTAAHRQGIVHGDLTCASILLDADGNALLAGFGIAGRINAEAGAGADDSPILAPPELRHGEAMSERADIWSLATVAIELLAGLSPDPEQPAAVLSRHRADLPGDLVAALAQATSPAPSNRHERVTDLLRDLRRAAGADVVAMPEAGEPAKPPRNPYKGLQAFGEADAADFFGREALVDRLVEALRQRRFVMLAGPSGSGKSSVLHAGLLPALRADRIPGARDWLLATMFPGSYPFEELNSALLGVGISTPGDRPPSSTDGLVGTLARVLPGAGEVLLVIDQFEELWSLTDDADRRRRFISELVDAVSDLRSRLRVVVAVRTDFLEHVLDHHLLGELVRRGLVLVTAPSADELAQAISRPARNTGLDFEPGLIDMVVRDVVDQPGALPLLQHALSELYLARDGARLTRAAYRESGGVSGALGRRADEVYRGLPRRAHGVARQIFLRLVAVDEQRNDSRRRVRRSELNALPADPRLVAQVLQEFGAHRLLAFDRDPVTRGPTVEVAHEALFREWRLLRGWIEARREALLRHRGLRVAAADWKSSGEAADYLYAGGRLEEAEQWRASSDISLTADEQRFLTTSREREDNRTRQRLQRRRMTVSAMGVAAVAGISLAAIAFLQLGRAEAGEREAQARALAASSRGQLLIDQDLAVLLAMQAVDISSQGGAQPIIEAVDALHTALAEHRTVASADAGGFFVGFGGNDLLFSAGPPQNQPTIWSATRGEILHRLEPGGEAPTDAAVSAGGRYAAETYADAPTVVWDLANGAVVAQVGEPGLIHDVPALSRDGTLMAEVSISPETGPGADATNIAIYELPAGRRIASFPASAVRELEFGPDGAWLAIAQDDVATIRLMDTRTGETLRTLGVPRDGSGVADIDFDAGFSRMAILAHSPSRIEVVDVADGDLIQRIALGAEPDQVCFVTEGAWVVTEAADEVTQIWDVASGAPVMSLPGSDHQRAMACAADGQSIAVSGAQGYTRVFDLAASASAEVTTFPTEPPAGGFWSPDGAVILWHDGGTIRRYDRDGRPLARTPEEWVGGLPVTALSGDGNLLAAQPAPGPDGRPQLIDLLDAESLEVVGAMDGPGGPLAFSPDGGLLLAGGSAGSLIYDVVSGARLKELTSPVNGEGYFAPSGVFLADAIHAVVQNGAGPEAWIYDVTSGAHVGTICSSDDSNRVALSPSGQLLVTGDYPGSAETWPVDELLAATRGAPAECVGDGTDPSEAALAARWSAPTQGGLRFSPDGRWLASTSGFDGEFGVWEVATQRPILNMKLDGTVSVLGFSPDGRHLAIGLYEPRGGQHSVRVYALGADELMGIAGAKVTRGMTDEECRTYLEVDACP